MSLSPSVKFAGTVPKSGRDSAQCQDRYSTSPLRFAVADGASESGYSEVWATLLTNAFCRSEANAWDRAAVDAWLTACRRDWQEWAESQSARDLPWFTREMLRAGSSATFVGVSFALARGQVSWRALACGDACVFQVRDGQLATAFPCSDAGLFDNTPPLVLTSRAPRARDMQHASGVAEEGDGFYLMTDALADWFLRAHRDGGTPWTVLDDVVSADDLDRFLASARDAGTLKNDDVTLLTIGIDAHD